MDTEYLLMSVYYKCGNVNSTCITQVGRGIGVVFGDLCVPLRGGVFENRTQMLEGWLSLFARGAVQRCGVGEETGETACVERWNNTFRQCLARLLAGPLICDGSLGLTVQVSLV